MGIVVLFLLILLISELLSQLDKILFAILSVSSISISIFSNFNLLVDAELSCKKDYYLTNIHCEQVITKIADKGRKYFN